MLENFPYATSFLIMSARVHVPQPCIRAFVYLCAALGEKRSTIQEKLHILFGDKAPQKSFVYKWMDPPDNDGAFNDAPRSGRPISDENLTNMIRDMITDEPFHSTRSIAFILCVSRETVRHILLSGLNLRKLKCKWIPYTLTDIRRKKRVESALTLHAMLTEDGILPRIITGDQSWFYLDNPVDEQWAASTDDVQRNIARTMQSKKVMVTILWGIKGFYLVEALPSDQNYNSTYFCELLTRLRSNLRKHKGVKRIKFFHLHLDNAKVHRSLYTEEKAEELGFTMLQHPPYSPDLAPSDFYLFGYIKMQLKGRHFETVAMLMIAIDEILRTIPPWVLSNVMGEWIERLETVIQNDGSYIES